MIVLRGAAGLLFVALGLWQAVYVGVAAYVVSSAVERMESCAELSCEILEARKLLEREAVLDYANRLWWPSIQLGNLGAAFSLAFAWMASVWRYPRSDWRNFIVLAVLFTVLAIAIPQIYYGDLIDATTVITD